MQRLGIYAEDSWRATPHLTLNYGLRYDTTFGLFTASGTGGLVRRFRKPGAEAEALDAVRQYWKRSIDAVQVDSRAFPRPIDQRPLMYQTLSCRLWGRS